MRRLAYKNCVKEYHISTGDNEETEEELNTSNAGSQGEEEESDINVADSGESEVTSGGESEDEINVDSIDSEFEDTGDDTELTVDPGDSDAGDEENLSGSEAPTYDIPVSTSAIVPGPTAGNLCLEPVSHALGLLENLRNCAAGVLKDTEPLSQSDEVTILETPAKKFDLITLEDNSDEEDDEEPRVNTAGVLPVEDEESQETTDNDTTQETCDENDLGEAGNIDPQPPTSSDVSDLLKRLLQLEERRMIAEDASRAKEDSWRIEQRAWRKREEEWRRKQEKNEKLALMKEDMWRGEQREWRKKEEVWRFTEVEWRRKQDEMENLWREKEEGWRVKHEACRVTEQLWRDRDEKWKEKEQEWREKEEEWRQKTFQWMEKDVIWKINQEELCSHNGNNRPTKEAFRRLDQFLNLDSLLQQQKKVRQNGSEQSDVQSNNKQRSEEIKKTEENTKVILGKLQELVSYVSSSCGRRDSNELLETHKDHNHDFISSDQQQRESDQQSTPSDQQPSPGGSARNSEHQGVHCKKRKLQSGLVLS